MACLNCFFPFTKDPEALKRFLSCLYPEVEEVLPISSSEELPLSDGRQPLATFEWIGEKNHLNEPQWGDRGQNCTSIDVMFRFRTAEHKIHVVLAEWKYCERYKTAKCTPISKSGTDRASTYRPHLSTSGCQLSLGSALLEDLFFDPIYQLMRQQLLASAMEREREMDADVVSVLHIAPRANDGLLNLELSQRIAQGATVGEVWSSIVKPGRFKSLATEDLIPLLVQSGADPAWTEYIDKRYGGIGKPDQAIKN